VSGVLESIYAAVIIFHLSFTVAKLLLLPVTIDTIDFRCCKRSRDVGLTSFASGDLENVCITFEVFHLSFTIPELLLLPVGD
jgi:hypothetical protein